MEKELKCKMCGCSRKLGRRLCSKCNSKRVVKWQKTLVMGRYSWDKQCIACQNDYKALRKDQKFCKDCYELRQHLSKPSQGINPYEYKEGWTHRKLAESLLGKKLSYNDIVHHVDNNPTNNEITNLMVISRSNHGKLHKFLDDQRVILEKSGNENLGNCWNNLIIPMTTAWLETTGAKVIKLWELGQSAAEPL